MARVTTGKRLSHHARERRFATKVQFPRWILAAFVVIIGFVLWMGVISDPSGKLRTPSRGSIFYVATVIGVAAFLAHYDRHRDPAGRSVNLNSRYGTRRNTTAN